MDKTNEHRSDSVFGKGEEVSILIKGMTAEQLLDVFEWARIGANNCMIGHGVVATELPDHGDLVDVDLLKAECKEPYVWWETETQMADILKDAPVVIPAERGEDE